MRYGVQIETFKSAGQYHHKVNELYGVGPKGVGEISDAVIEAQKKVNELLWEEMPENSTGLVAKIEYRNPKRL